jgi:hypothetical protein
LFLIRVCWIAMLTQGSGLLDDNLTARSGCSGLTLQSTAAAAPLFFIYGAMRAMSRSRQKIITRSSL